MDNKYIHILIVFISYNIAVLPCLDFSKHLFVDTNLLLGMAICFLIINIVLSIKNLLTWNKSKLNFDKLDAILLVFSVPMSQKIIGCRNIDLGMKYLLTAIMISCFILIFSLKIRKKPVD